MDKAKSGAERRTAARVDTHQHVIFSDRRATGPLRTGTAVDRSTGGLRIVTAFPETVGSMIQIELQHGSASGVALLEGRVMHVVPTENGLYAMGIRLMSKMLRPAAPTRVSGAAPARAPVAAAARRLDVTVGSAGDTAAAAASGQEPVTFRRLERRNGAGSWIGLFAILALVMILVLLILEAMKDRGRETALDGPYKNSPASAPNDRVADGRLSGDTQQSTEPEYRLLASTRNRASDPQGFANASGVFGTVRSVDDALVSAVFTPAQAMLANDVRPAAPVSRRTMTVERFVNQLEYAQDAFGAGDAGFARTLVRRSLRDAESVPRAWRDYAEELLLAFESNARSAPGSGLEQLLAFTPSNAADASFGRDGVRVDVDASDHTMRVWRDGALVAEFPVGLGRDGRTPRGTYRIASKVTDPAWYAPDGRVVPAGDPGNPIGAQWMGLASGPASTGIGIHPTAQAASIGGDASQGCVRMRPADAATLYRLAPMGTPVRIHD